MDDFNGFLTNAKYAELAKCSPDTALRDIRELAACGLLVQNPGRGRGTSYRLADIEDGQEQSARRSATARPPTPDRY